MTYGNGSTTSDRTCRCNSNEGYSFVTNPINLCSCNPATEDCSCYIGINKNNNIIGSKGEIFTIIYGFKYSAIKKQ